MELLNKQFLETWYFDIIKTVLKRHYMTKDNLNSMISYNEFKDTIITFVEKIMEILLMEISLKNEEYKYDKLSCIIKEMPSTRRGEFYSENNVVVINEDVIRKLYYWDLKEFFWIFHELNHFKIKYDLVLEKINQDLVRIAKEELLSIGLQELSKEKSDIKLGIKHRDDYYYDCNYELFSEEKVANIEAVKNLILFLNLCDINLSEEEMMDLENITISNKKEYENYIRDVSHNFYFNNKHINFEEAFDIMIRHKNQEWVEIPQIQIEYYKDSMGNIKKRTNDELRELLELETQPNKRIYIEQLLMSNINKNLNEYKDLKNENIEKISNEINNKTK